MSGIERVLRELANAPTSFERWRDGAECPDEFELAALAEERLDETRLAAVRSHLGRCGACLSEVQTAFEELQAVAEERAAPAPLAKRLRLVQSPAAWVGLAAAAALLLLLWNPFTGGGGPLPEDAVALARLEASPARVTRGPAEGAELAFREGLALYVEEDWAGAFEALVRAEEQAETEGLDLESRGLPLFLGSTELLLGRAAEARSRLEQATGADTMGREARWQAAQACLALALPIEAREHLEVLAESTGARTDEATSQLAELANLGF